MEEEHKGAESGREKETSSEQTERRPASREREGGREEVSRPERSGEQRDRGYRGGGGDRRRDSRPGGGRRPFFSRFSRRKVCHFCIDKIEYVDYKDIGRLRKYVTDRGKIIPRRISGACAGHQRQLTRAIKRARYIALLPYKSE